MIRLRGHTIHHDGQKLCGTVKVVDKDKETSGDAMMTYEERTPKATGKQRKIETRADVLLHVTVLAPHLPKTGLPLTGRHFNRCRDQELWQCCQERDLVGKCATHAAAKQGLISPASHNSAH